MPDPLAHSPDMITIRPHKMPALWWLFPWSYTSTLHMAANALRAMCDRQDQALTMQAHIIADQSEEISFLRQRVDDLNDSIIRGTAITPDAQPHRDETIHE